MEIFKDIQGYFGLYQVSNMGNVKSLGNDKKRKDKILKQSPNSKGYLQVTLCKDSKIKRYYIHRLVANEFLPNHQNLEQINHRNELKTDNRVENLEWCTAKQNINYGTRNKRIAESHINNPKQSKQVLCVETNKIYPSTMEVERHLGFANSNISSACRGRIKQAYGYTWRYV